MQAAVLRAVRLLRTFTEPPYIYRAACGAVLRTYTIVHTQYRPCAPTAVSGARSSGAGDAPSLGEVREGRLVQRQGLRSGARYVRVPERVRAHDERVRTAPKRTSCCHVSRGGRARGTRKHRRFLFLQRGIGVCMPIPVSPAASAGRVWAFAHGG